MSEPIKVECQQFFDLLARVNKLEEDYHDMAEKLFTRVELIEDRLKEIAPEIT